MMTATAATEQDTNSKWLLSGDRDEDGEALKVVVAFEGGVFVMTAF